MDSSIFNYVPNYFNESYKLLQNPEKQKHKVKVAVMDTGVDPGARGLKSCPDGSTKIIDVIDCTGSDDVIVTNVDKSEIEHVMFDILDDALNESYEDYPDSVVCYKGIRSLRSFLSDSKYKYFGDMHKKVIDSTVLDIYVFNYRNHDMCIIEYGDDRTVVLDEYHIKQNYGSIILDEETRLNFVFKLYDHQDNNKKICSLVFDAGGHATHVAGIIGSFFGNNNEMNGINPNCQILSLKIGDIRVNSMETSIALTRALQEIVKHDCHIVNYSYGEPIGTLGGRFMEMLEEYVYKYNITFITSAGNSGPGITTVGAPAAVSDRLISVGAYVNNVLLRNMYYTNSDSFQEGLYEWSSRGPGLDESMGVDVMAVGCALTSQPEWYKSDIRMCNGTSMAAPNATGFLSLILSQFNTRKEYPHTFWMKKYLESTCKKINYQCFSQGNGLIGQTYIDLNFFDDCSYYYELNIDNGNKKGIVNVVTDDADDADDGTDCRNVNVNRFRVDLAIRALPECGKKFIAKHAIHRLNMVYDESLNGHVDGPKKIISHVGCQTIMLDIKSNKQLSGYVNIYEDTTRRLIGYIPINQFVCKEMARNDCLKDIKVLKPGIIDRTYIYPKSNVIKCTLDGYFKNGIYVDIIQYYKGKCHEYRKISKKLHEGDRTLIRNVTTNVMTEICVYTSCKTLETEEIDFKIECSHTNVRLLKNLFEMEENVSLMIDRHYKLEHNKQFGGSMSVNSVFTKYYPVSSIYMKPDNRYVDKNGNPLKLLRLTYKVNKHKNGIYYINTFNRIYESSIYMSGNIAGYRHGKLVFHANYVPKKVYSYVDTVNIEFMDSDEKRLEQCSNIALTVVRELDKAIETKYIFRKGMNYVNIPHDQIRKLKEVYDGDYIQCNILDESFVIIFKKAYIRETHNMPITRQLKDFNHVKKFVNTITNDTVYDNINNTYTDDTLATLEKAISYTDPDCYTSDYYEQLVDMSNMDRLNYQFVGTLLTEIGNDINKSRERLQKRLKITHDNLEDSKLSDTVPYCVIKLAKSMNDKKNNIDDISNKMEIISMIEDDLEYWENCHYDDIRKLKNNIIDNVKNNDNYKQIIGRKRRLMNESDERVF